MKSLFTIHKSIFLFTCLALIVTLGLVGCSGDDDDVVTTTTVSKTLTNKLVDTEWGLVSYGKIGSEVTAVPGKERDYFIHFGTSNGFYGYSGCNEFGGEYYAYEDGQFETCAETVYISTIAITARYCEGYSELMVQEGILHSALHDSDSYELSGDSLKLYYDSRQSVINLFRKR